MATVSGTGLLITVGYGQTEVAAQHQGLTAGADVNVSAPVPTNGHPVRGTLTATRDQPTNCRSDRLPLQLAERDGPGR